MSTVSVGLVSFGVAARVLHAPLIQATPGLSVDYVVERSRSESAQIFPSATIVRSLEALLATDVRLVVVATPSHLHYEHAKAALQAGKDVVVDKPFAATAAEADELIALAAAQGRLLTVFHNRRQDADFRTIRHVLTEGLLGDVVEFEGRFDRWRPALKGNWKEVASNAASGTLYDRGAHLIDQALQLFGTPSAVAADVRCQRPGATATDFFDVRLDYADRPGLVVRVRAGELVRLADAAPPRYVVCGTRGTFVKTGMDVQEAQLRAGMLPTDAGFGVEGAEQHGRLVADVAGLQMDARVESLPGNFLGFYGNVADALLRGAEPDVRAEEARDVLRVIELAMESAGGGGGLVSWS